MDIGMDSLAMYDFDPIAPRRSLAPFSDNNTEYDDFDIINNQIPANRRTTISTMTRYNQRLPKLRSTFRDRSISLTNVDSRGKDSLSEYDILSSNIVVAGDDQESYPQGEKQQFRLIREIAIYIQHGDNYFNPKHHPDGIYSIWAYSLMHTLIYHCTDWCFSLLLLLLAIIEEPLKDDFQDSKPVLNKIAIVMEFLILCYFGFDALLRIVWYRRKIFTHKLSLLRLLGVFLIFVDIVFAIFLSIYLKYQTPTTFIPRYFRILRCFRPTLFMTSHLNRNVRNVIYQFMNTIVRIMDLYIFYIIYLTVFAVVGFYLFHEIDNENFSTLENSFISLFALSTTVNFPDVMLPSLRVREYYFLYFLIFLCFGLYVLTNLILAIVKENFTLLEKEKLQNLLNFRRISLKKAFSLGQNFSANGWDYSLFSRVIKYLHPFTSDAMLMLMFKVLDRNKSSRLSWSEFNQLANVLSLSWSRKEYRNKVRLWHNIFEKWLPILSKFVRYMYIVVDSWVFKAIIYIIITVNLLFLLVDTEFYQGNMLIDESYTQQYVFISLYTIEFILQIVGYGPMYYFTRGWHLFDFSILFFAILFLTLENVLHFNELSGLIVLLRTLRLLRILKYKKTFRQSFGVILMSLPKMIRFITSIGLIFYFFSILGMTFYSNKIQACSFNDKKQSDWNPKCGFEFNLASEPPGLYYLANFDDIFSSLITLFSLMVINNWHLIMKGYVAITGSTSYFFFLSFYLFVVLVATNVTVAFILDLYESFSRHRDDKDHTFAILVSLNLYEAQHVGYKNPPEGGYQFVGEKKLNQLDALMLLYRDEDWVKQDEISPVGNFFIGDDNDPTSDVVINSVCGNKSI